MEIIQTPYGNFNVYINTISSPQGLSYHISFVDKSKKTQIFTMEMVNNQLEFVNSLALPQWVSSLKDQFEGLVTKHRKREFQELRSPSALSSAMTVSPE